MKILFFTELSPFPVNGGERIRSYGLLKALSDLNYDVNAIFQNEDQVDLKEYELPNVNFISYSNNRKNLTYKIFNGDFFYKQGHVINIFKESIAKCKPDIVILDFFLAPKYFSFFRKNNIPFVVGTHNVESKLIWQRPTKNVFKFLRKCQEYLYMLFHERFIYKLAQGIIAVSEEDTEKFKRVLPHSNIHFIPNFLNQELYKSKGKKEDYIVMTANFNAYMNNEGLKWLLDYVWSDEIDKCCKLKLVGKGSKESFAPYMNRYFNIEAIGAVEDITEYIDKAKCVIVPLLHGSGTRLKCLEAMALKTPIISTSKGREGIISKYIITIDDPIKFREEVMRFNVSNEIGQFLYEDFLKEYSLQSNMYRVQNLINSILI